MNKGLHLHVFQFTSIVTYKYFKIAQAPTVYRQNKHQEQNNGGPTYIL